MTNLFKSLGKLLTCRCTDEQTSQSARPSSWSRSVRPREPAQRVQIPLGYVSHEPAKTTGPEQKILGRKSSYSVASSLNEDAHSLSLADVPLRSESSSVLSDPDAIMGSAPPLLAAQVPELSGRKLLVLDLDETLVHSSFKFVATADFVIPVDIEGHVHNVYVIKRPGVDEFLEKVGQLFEVVVFTASVAKYGDPLLDNLDRRGIIHHRLFRESCYNYNGNYIKNLSMLGRPLEKVIIIDNSPASYTLQPQHAVPVSTWFSDVHDTELLGMIPFLTALANPDVEDVSIILRTNF